MPLEIAKLSTPTAREAAAFAFGNPALRVEAEHIAKIPDLVLLHNQNEANLKSLRDFAVQVGASSSVFRLDQLANELRVSEVTLRALAAQLESMARDAVSAGHLQFEDFQLERRSGLQGIDLVAGAIILGIAALISLVIVGLGFQLGVARTEVIKREETAQMRVKGELELEREALSTFMSNNPQAVPPNLEPPSSPIETDPIGPKTAFFAGVIPLLAFGAMALLFASPKRRRS